MTNYECLIEGDEQVTIRATSEEAAARQYVAGGDWSPEDDGWTGEGTLSVMVWRTEGETAPDARRVIVHVSR